MPDTNDLRLFEELRLHPWKESDQVKIKAHLAMLSVTNPKEAAEMTKRYDAKMDVYLAKKEEEKPKITHEFLMANLKVGGKPLGSEAVSSQEIAEVKEVIAKPKKAKKFPSPISDDK